MHYKTYWTYIVQCKDDSFYIGVTSDVEGRVWEHNNSEHSKKAYTYTRRPVKLVYCEEFYDVWDAIEREKQIKGWSRKKKQSLIDENWDNLIQYCQRKTPNRV